MTFRGVTLLSWLILHLAVRGGMCLRAMQIRVPEAAVSGSTVTLGCDYDLEQAALYSIKWYINDEEFYRYVPKESPPTRVFPMPHVNVDVSRSDAREVSLRAVQRELTGYYQCEVSADAPLFHTDIRGAYMTVAEIPSGEPVLRVESQKVEIGEKIRANCSSPASYPSTNITWYINDEKVTDGGIHDARVSPTLVTRDVDPELGLDASRSSLEVVAAGALFTRGGRAALRCDATLYSLYAASARAHVLEDTPHLAPVMGPTAPQRGVDDARVPTTADGGIHDARVSPTLVTRDVDPELGLDASRSSLEVVAAGALFTRGGRAALRCDATLYSLYAASARAHVLEDTPHLAPVMGPTAPQRGVDEARVPTTADGGIHDARVSPTLVTRDVDPELGLDASRSSLEVVAAGALFSRGGRAALRCDATLYSLYAASARAHVLEDTPHLAPVMGPTAPQRGVDDARVPTTADIVSNRSLSRTVSQFLITLQFVSLLLTVR